MKCFHPITIQETKKLVPCGRCYACLRNRQKQWSVRLSEQMKSCTDAYFITLTYNDENVPVDKNGNMIVSKEDVKKFIKRLRFNKSGRKNSGIKYYLASEYGPTTNRPHYHAIIFNLGTNDQVKARQMIEKAWSVQEKDFQDKRISLGFVQCEKVNEKRINYVTGYIMDSQKENNSGFKVFALMSRGLGLNYLDSQARVDWHRENPIENNYYPLPGGEKVALPRYYRDKLYDDEMLEIMQDEMKSTNWMKHVTKDNFINEHGRHNYNKENAERRHNKKQQKRKL